jgi:hypothetical protein
MYTSQLELNISLCFKGFEESSYETKCCLSKLLATLLSLAIHENSSSLAIQASNLKYNEISKRLDFILSYLSNAFNKNTNSFLALKSDKSNKGINQASRDLRIGISYTYIEFAKIMGSQWLEKNLNLFMRNILNLLHIKTALTPTEDLFAIKCANFILRCVIGNMLNEKAQLNAAKELISFIKKAMKNIGKLIKKTLRALQIVTFIVLLFKTRFHLIWCSSKLHKSIFQNQVSIVQFFVQFKSSAV